MKLTVKVTVTCITHGVVLEISHQKARQENFAVYILHIISFVINSFQLKTVVSNFQTIICVGRNDTFKNF